MLREVILVKAFTQDSTKGNPAGVILHADGLSSEHMLAIARKFGFSESAFVQKPSREDADYRLRFYSLTQEVDLCAHATIATFHALVLSGNIVFGKENEVRKTQESTVGILPVTCYKDGLIMMTQNQPSYFEPEKNRSTIAKLLSLPESALVDQPIQTVSTGVPKLLIPIQSLDALFAIQPDLEGIKEYCKKTGARGFYPFTPETQDKNASYHARQFNPLAGIDEDPITGVAAGALGAYVVKHSLLNKKRFIIEQGVILGKGGKIVVDVGSTIQVGGYAVLFGKEIVELENHIV